MNDYQRPSGFSLMPEAVKNILIINGLLFLATIVLGNKGIDLTSILGLHYWGGSDFRFFQFITYQFMHGAMFLGMEADIGSISVGKLADLMVLNTNPLENIRNTADIRYVMKAGTLYDAMSLDEIWPKAKPYGDNYWYVPQMYEKSVKAVGTYDRK